MGPAKAQWVTPLVSMRIKDHVWQKLEDTSPKREKVGQSPEINFFNNPAKYKRWSSYDNYFAYTKVCPLFDTKKVKDNSTNLNDIWANIHQEEKDKAVPVLTSMNYGRPCRPQLDMPETQFRRIRATDGFNSKAGVFHIDDDKHV